MKYRKPRSFNSVTFIILLVLGLSGYVLVCLWPVYTASARVTSMLHDQIPALYKANLRPDSASSMVEVIKEDIAKELEKLGINEKAAKIFISRSPQEIGIEVRFKAKAHFPYPDRVVEFDLSPKVVSDATRVDW
jgi:hypothetical protein